MNIELVAQSKQLFEKLEYLFLQSTYPDLGYSIDDVIRFELLMYKAEKRWQRRSDYYFSQKHVIESFFGKDSAIPSLSEPFQPKLGASIQHCRVCGKQFHYFHCEHCEEQEITSNDRQISSTL